MTKKSFAQFFTIMTIAVSLIAASCKKEHTDNNTGSSDSIVGKWKLNKQVIWSTSGSLTTKDTSDFTSTDSYEDFRSDGKSYEKYFDHGASNYFYDTATYSVTGTTVNTVDVHGISYSYQIQNKTANSMMMYNTVVNTSKLERWFFLTK